MSKETPTRKTLADIIMEKVKEKETEIMTLASERGELSIPEKIANPKIVAVYEGFNLIFILLKQNINCFLFFFFCSLV